MERLLGVAAGWVRKTARGGRGQTILIGAVTECILGEGKVEGVRLKDGRLIPADLVVMALGIRPNTALATEAGLAVGRGIHVDDHTVTSDPSITAAGECVEHRGLFSALVAPLGGVGGLLARGVRTGARCGRTGAATGPRPTRGG